MSHKQANLLLVLVTVGWGSSYLFTKVILDEMEPFTLVGIRFLIAFLVTALILWRRVRYISKATLFASFILGTLLCAVSVAFGYALRITDASTAGFLIATTVVFVPIIMVGLTKKLPSKQVTMGSIVTLAGLAIFSIKDSLTVDSGMVFCLATAFLYAVHIVVNNFYVRQGHNGIQLGVYQLLFGGVLSLITGLFVEPFTLPSSSAGWSSLLLLAIICSAFAVVVQSAVQKYTTAEHTGFIFALEPIFAAVLAFIFLEEVMNAQELTGALFIFLGVLVANYTPKKQLNIETELT